MKLTEEQKKNRRDIAEIHKRYMKERGKDRIKYHDVGDPDFSYRTFVLFGGTEVSEGGWMIGRKWMTAKFMNDAETRWVKQSYKTRADNVLKDNAIPQELRQKLQEIDREYDLSAGCVQCGGCRWYAAIDGDYGFCCNLDSPNEGRITFEHGGCIRHHFIQELLLKGE